MGEDASSRLFCREGSEKEAVTKRLPNGDIGEKKELVAKERHFQIFEHRDCLQVLGFGFEDANWTCQSEKKKGSSVVGRHEEDSPIAHCLAGKPAQRGVARSARGNSPDR